MWRDVALVRTISRFLRQIRVPYSQDYMWATLVKHAAHRGRHRAAVPRALRSAPRRHRRASARRARPRSSAEIEAALQKVESLDEDRILRHFVNAVQAAVRTNFYQLDADGQPKALIAIKFASRKLDGAAAAAAALRDLRLFAAGRGRASALRQGRARRHPLVRPAAGFPHRGARPGEGAAGQERRDRAGRRQGRLRAEAACRIERRPREAVQAEGTAAYKLFISTLLDITDNLGDDGVDPARQRRAPRRRRSLSRGRRRQGHRDLLRHRQRASRPSTASGSATPSRPAARPATTTRRWASPRAAPGRR